MAAMNYIGYATGSPLVNLFYDAFGTYRPVFLSFALLMPVVSIIFVFVIKASGKDKKAVIAAAEAPAE